jgi:hypothetical protein
MRAAGYNSRQTMSFYKGLLGLVLVLSAGAQAATSWDPSAAQLAKEIAAIAGPGTASLTIRNSSSIPNDDVPQIRKTLELQLRDAGVQLRGEENAATALRVTLSENARGYLWVAEVQQGSETRVAMLEVERTNADVPVTAQSVTLRKTLLWSQPNLMLDAALIKVGLQDYIAVLEPTQVVVYRMTGGKPQIEQTLAIPNARAGRDPRGLLVPATGYPFDVYVPGITCTSNAALPLYLSCKQSDDPWPMGSQKAFFNSSRNYFTGALAPGIGRQAPPFYSAAELPRSNYSLWIFAGVNGQFRAVDKINDVPLSVASTREWGSDIASIRGCGNATYVVASTPGSSDEDSVRAYEVTDRDPLAVSLPLQMMGPVLALWREGDAATAVVKNNRTNFYEAHSISVGCSQ